MGVLKSFATLGALLLCSDAALGLQTVATDTDHPQLSVNNFNRYIVKFSAQGSAKLKRRDGTHDTDSFYSTLSTTGADTSPAQTYNSDIFSGVSFNLENASNQTLADIQALPEVEKIWPASYITIPVSGTATTVGTDAAAASTEYAPWTSHNDTNVALMQSRGYLGEGVVIAFVDTGVDYNHPALGGGFGPGFKIDKGYDLVGNDYVAGGDLVPDDDPMDCLGHGTHTAGIAGSIDSWIPGVAPNATLREYKVFGCTDGTLEDIIVSAFLQAYEEGADIISASLGSDNGFPDSAMAEVATQVSEQGVFVAIAAGNSGAYGAFYTSSGGNGRGSAAVGSVQAVNWIGYTTIAHSSSGEDREIVYLSDELTQFAISGNATAYFPSGVRDRTACDYDLPGSSSGDVYIIPRGTCLEQIQDTTLIGLATWVFYVSNGSEFELYTREVYRDDQPTGEACILYDDGDWLMSQYENNYTVTFTFAEDHEAVAIPRASYLAGRMNSFSSWGPTLDGRMKPEIAAPGGSILSTYLDDGWATYSGTSMATPYIAAVAALLYGSIGGRSAVSGNAAQFALERIVASGRPIYSDDGTDYLASQALQGAGLVDAQKVIEYVTSVSPANVNLNDTAHFVGTHEITVTNSGTEEVTYEVSHNAGSTVQIKDSADYNWVNEVPPIVNETGSVAFSADTLTVAAGATATLTLEFTEPPTLNASYLPVYGGQVVLTGSNGEVVAVTYMGIKGNLYDCNLWELDRGAPLMLSGRGGVVTAGLNYSFADDDSGVPQVYTNVLWSTGELSFDFVTKDWTASDWVYPPVANENNWVGSFRLVPDALYGTVVDFPYENFVREESGFYAEPQAYFSDNRSIPTGDYMILARALRTYGDKTNIDDWSYKVSEWFHVERENETATATSASSTVAATSTATTSTAVATSSAAATTTAEACSATSTPVSLAVYIGNETTAYNFYQYSNFLAIDLDGSETDLAWAFVNGSVFRTSNDGTTEYMSVHTNTNSLVYMYTSAQIASPWSYLDCTIDAATGDISCVSDTKHLFYVCDSTSGIVRHGTTVLDGCTAITVVATLDDCANTTTTTTTTTASSTVSSTAASTASATAACSTDVPISLTATVAGDDTSYELVLYSDFLALEFSTLSSANTALANWTLANSSLLQTVSGSTTKFASAVNTNNNSLIYMYTASRITGIYQYLECSIGSTGNVSCASAGKDLLYVCDTSAGVLRNGPVVVDGCTLVTLHAEVLCSNETATASSTATTASSTEAASSASSSALVSSTVPANATTAASTVSSTLTSSSAFASSTAPVNSTAVSSASSAVSSASTLVSTASTNSTTAVSTTSSSAVSSESSTIVSPTAPANSTTVSSTVSSTLTASTNSTTVSSTASSTSAVSTSANSTTTASTASSSAVSSTVSSSSAVSTSTSSASSSTLSSASSSVSSSSASSVPASSEVSSSAPASSTVSSSAFSSKPASSASTSASTVTSASSAVSSTASSTASSTVSSKASSAGSSTASSAVSTVTSGSSSASSAVSSSAVSSSAVSSPAVSSSAVSGSATSKSVHSSASTGSSASSTEASSSTAKYDSTGSTAASSSATTSASSGSSSSQEYTTSTVYSTTVYTVTSCAPTVTNCPANSVSVTTEIIAISTTICPVTATETEASSGAGSTKTSASAVTSPSATTPAGSTVAQSGSASGRVSTSSSASYSPTSTEYTTSTVYSTRVYTVTSCAPTVTNCPASSISVTSEIIIVSTTVCPVTESATASGQASSSSVAPSSGAGSSSSSSSAFVSQPTIVTLPVVAGTTRSTAVATPGTPSSQATEQTAAASSAAGKSSSTKSAATSAAQQSSTSTGHGSTGSTTSAGSAGSSSSASSGAHAASSSTAVPAASSSSGHASTSATSTAAGKSTGSSASSSAAGKSTAGSGSGPSSSAGSVGTATTTSGTTAATAAVSTAASTKTAAASTTSTTTSVSSVVTAGAGRVSTMMGGAAVAALLALVL